MASFKISNATKLDLKQIWIFTAENWSEKLADKYYKEIIHEFQRLSDFLKSGKAINQVKEGYRIGYVKSHM